MASQKDLQDLLRILTTGRNKLPMLSAMGRVQALQAAGLYSISDIAASTAPALINAISDEKAAKSLLAACKANLKSPADSAGSKRASDSALPSSKRTKLAYVLDTPQTPQELEASLALPQPSEDEEAISKCTVYTNRAPLVLAFAVQLLKYTMPEQPLSSRLSLGQAVVSVNSRSKALSIGLEKGKSADEEGWGRGQPKVKVMGRAISVLKRSGYEWREEEVKTDEDKMAINTEVESQSTVKEDDSTPSGFKPEGDGWTVSSPISSKGSTFVARSITVTTPTQAENFIRSLVSFNVEIRSADHNMYAYRVQSPTSNNPFEENSDNGERGAGPHLLGILQADNLQNVLLVVTRWYGGVFLGPDRWRIMSQVSRDALSQRLRVAGVLGHEPLWGLDLEAMRSKDGSGTNGLPIHRPEGAREYILNAFASPPEKEKENGAKGKGKKKTLKRVRNEKEDNLGMLLGALDKLIGSWVGQVGREELDRMAWGWYVSVRPEVESGIAGWGGKGEVKLSEILKLKKSFRSIPLEGNNNADKTPT
ncbi:Protein IMPACT [Lachnellula subtilissima]|uniref:Protein IMPACT n=1 Tax=Lachnellula subtilissima TaxID=602034 RepID=A0A8H8U5T7_9HELO|nr:Protein IMPACT [Lachnellula subtilissima]